MQIRDLKGAEDAGAASADAGGNQGTPVVTEHATGDAKEAAPVAEAFSRDAPSTACEN